MGSDATTARTAARNARLDALLTATEKWGEIRKKQLTDAVALSKAILKGRTGSDRLAAATVNATSEEVLEEIDEFLGL